MGRFDRIESPWLPMAVSRRNPMDGCVVLKARAIAAQPVVVAAVEGKFQGGSMGEVSGAKMTTRRPGALDSQNGKPTAAVLLLETGGVRLQEANPDWLRCAEVMSSILALRQHAPIITVIAGTVGCFGGSAGRGPVELHRYDARKPRLGLNGPEVIEQESGIEEFDSSDRGARVGHQRRRAGVGMDVADELAPDDASKANRRKRSGGALKSGLPRCIAVSRWRCIANASRNSTQHNRSTR